MKQGYLQIHLSPWLQNLAQWNYKLNGSIGSVDKQAIQVKEGEQLLILTASSFTERDYMRAFISFIVIIYPERTTCVYMRYPELRNLNFNETKRK